MIKSELVTRIADKGEYTKKDAEKALNVIVDVIKDALSEGEKVSIPDFGMFEVREKAERKGINPQTKEEIIVPARKSPAFKAAKKLKDLVNEG